MKPSRFEYCAPEMLDEAVALLAADSSAKLIAGGQSLMPVLAFRLAAPSLLVDLRRLPMLREIALDADGVQLGAKVTWRDIENDRRLASAHPLLRAAVAYVAHYQIRNRGTVGGSLAHADPAAELPGIAVTCEGEIDVVGSAGRHRIRPISLQHRPSPTNPLGVKGAGEGGIIPVGGLMANAVASALSRSARSPMKYRSRHHVSGDWQTHPKRRQRWR